MEVTEAARPEVDAEEGGLEGGVARSRCPQLKSWMLSLMLMSTRSTSEVIGSLRSIPLQLVFVSRGSCLSKLPPPATATEFFKVLLGTVVGFDDMSLPSLFSLENTLVLILRGERVHFILVDLIIEIGKINSLMGNLWKAIYMQMICF